MSLNSGLRRQMSKGTYYLWVGVFFLIVISLVSLMYGATKRIDYVWQWYKLPRAFFYHEEVPIKAEIEGTISSVITTNDQTTIQIKGDDETISVEVPNEDIRVVE